MPAKGSERQLRRRRRKLERRWRRDAQRRDRVRRGARPRFTDADFDPEVQCWCGEKGRWSELYADEFLDDCCAGTGQLDCYCGGDFCVCHYHGGEQCPGCPECEDNDRYEDDRDWPEDGE